MQREYTQTWIQLWFGIESTLILYCFGSYLLAWIAWQVEHQHREESQGHAGYYQIYSVEQGFPAHSQFEGNIYSTQRVFKLNNSHYVTQQLTWKRLQGIRIILLILSRRHLEYIPLHRQIKLG